MKSLLDIYNQIESKQIELLTFNNIRDHELNAIPKRIEVLIFQLYINVIK